MGDIDCKMSFLLLSGRSFVVVYFSDDLVKTRLGTKAVSWYHTNEKTLFSCNASWALALLSHYDDIIKALLRLYSGSIKALSRLY